MAVITVAVRPSDYNTPSAVVEIPLEDPVATYKRPIVKVRQEPVQPQKTSRIAAEHEGSRRRRRYEMQNLLGCPQRVEPSAEDWVPVPIHRSTISWDKLATTDATRPLTVTRPVAARKANTLPRAIRQEMKRAHATPDFVYSIEKEFRDVIDPAPAEPDYDVVGDEEDAQGAAFSKRTVHIAIDAPTDKARSYSRWWIHLISKYYNLKSHSEDYHNQRVACVRLTGQKLPSVWFCDLL